MTRVFAFDMGKASIGYCVREDFDIKCLGSLIIDVDHASIDGIRKSRRIHRTIDSHKSREKYFNNLWTDCGLEILEKQDIRFSKEFSSQNDDTIYTSCLLRIALLQGKKLEEWQIYKALHSAIQRRGYDDSLPWATLDEQNTGKELIKDYTTENGQELIISDEYKYPCYYEAVRLKLWEEKNPENLKKFVPLENVTKVRNSSMSTTRELVKKELSKLWQEAQKQILALKKIPVEEFLYGEAKIAYASFNLQKYQKFRGKIKDLEGVLSQKVPRFDNRIIMKCKLLPKRNVCKSSNLEYIIFSLLMQLKNLRYVNMDGANGTRLSVDEIKSIYEAKLPSWIKQHKELKLGKNPSFTITDTDISSAIGIPRKYFKELNKLEKITVNTSGRSSFCKRACQIMNKIILAGELYPHDVDLSEFIDKTSTNNPITKEEIDEMVSKIGDWNNLYVPDNREIMYIKSTDERKQTDIFIGSITNPIVRNRLQLFRDLLLKLKKEYGTPDKVIFEFIRDGSANSLFSKNKADATASYYEKLRKKNDDIKEKLGDEYSIKKLVKMKLLEEQNYQCYYTGQKIAPSDIDNYDIEHIFPRSFMGCDALYNKILCLPYVNRKEKKDRTPYDWFKQDKTDEEWGEYLKRVSHILDRYPKPKKPKLNSKMKDYYVAKKEYELALKKYLLLTSPEEQCWELIEKNNLLSDTSYISKVAQKITAFVFGWGLQVKGEKRYIYTTNGSITHKMLNYYGLEKDRNDNRHHAQDAILISFSQMFMNEKNKHRIEIIDLINKSMPNVIPIPLSHKKQNKKRIQPKDNPFGKKLDKDNKFFLTHKILLSELEKGDIDKIIDERIKVDLKEKSENLSKEEFKTLLKNYTHPKLKTKVRRVLLKVSLKSIKLTYDKNGRERLGEYVDFGSKGSMGQFKTSDQAKGQILYYDEKGNIKVMPIYANKSTKEVKDTLIEMGCKLYNGGEIFYSGCLIEIPNDFKAGALTYPKGVYKLRTIKSKGETLIENNIGQEIPPSVKNLSIAGFYKQKN